MTSKQDADRQRQIAEIVAAHYDDPYGFVMAIFPWGQEHYYDREGNKLLNPLRNKAPAPWQKEELLALGQHIRDNEIRKQLGLETKVWRSAYASGHDVGKSAFVAWIIYFFMSTRVDTRGVVTASTQFQLEDKTWPELAKWHKLALNSDWFLWTATTLSFAKYPEDMRKNYRTTAATVSETNTEAFQGLHNEGRTVFAIFDEASGVLPKIWEVTEGILMDGEAYFFALGNPTKPEGEFPDCFEKHGDLYRHRHIDSRDVPWTNKGAIAETIKRYRGEDTDEVKVRVRGIFPSQSYNGFFDKDAILKSMRTEEIPPYDANEPLLMAIDVANTGPDETVIGFRRGWDARSIPLTTARGLKTMQIVELAVKMINIYRPDATFIENVGPGIGVADILKDRNFRVIRVYPGSLSSVEGMLNVRMDNHWAFRDWLYSGGVLPDDPELLEQMKSIQYLINKTTGKMQMEAKEDIKKRGLPSPDRLDMLTLTFAAKVARRDRNNELNGQKGRLAIMAADPTALGGGMELS